jgi:prolyl oligopeptidase
MTRPRLPAILAAAAALTAIPVHAQDADDPFRALEDVPAAHAFLKEQDARARVVLDAIPGRAALAERIRALEEGHTAITHVTLEGSRVFYLKAAPGLPVPVLCMREGFSGAERVLVDPQKRPGGADLAIDWFAPAPDGRHVAYGVSHGGSGDSVLRVITADNGRDLPFEIDRARFNRHLGWEPDARTFYYARIPEGNTGARRDANARLYRHVLDRDTAHDEVVFAPGVGGARDIPEVVEAWIEVPPGSRYAFAVAREGRDQDIAVHVTTQKELTTGKPAWHKLVGTTDDVMEIVPVKDDLYLLSHKKSPNRNVLRVAASAPNLAGAKTVVAEGDAVIQAMGVGRDAIYLRTMVAGVDRLERANLGLLGVGSREFLRTPFDTSIAELVADPSRAGAVLRLDGWVQPPSIAEVAAKSGDIVDTKLQPKPVADFSSIDEVRLYATAKDGTRIPITLLYARNTRLTHDNPTLLSVFGAFGDTASPHFDPARLAWLERGGVYAVAHVRGGGEFGEHWHEAARGASKSVTVLDFITACEFLEKYGFTNDNRLAIDGRHAGAIAVGGALVRRPDLFGAVIARDPLTDLLRLETSPSGRADLREFGSAATPAGAKALQAISPYRNIRDGMPYPGVLVAVRANDPRVDAWQAAKFAARLQKASSSGKPVLVRVDFAAGDEDSATPRVRHAQELADMYAFAFWQLGEKGYESPVPTIPLRP